MLRGRRILHVLPKRGAVWQMHAHDVQGRPDDAADSGEQSLAPSALKFFIFQTQFSEQFAKKHSDQGKAECSKLELIGIFPGQRMGGAREL